MKQLLFLILALALTAAPALGGARRFTYVYEVTTSPPGDIEIENWVTWKTRRPDDHSFREVDFRHELEFGITDKFQAAIYLADWNYQDGSSVENPGYAYTGSALELIYNFTNPVADPLGFSVYEEIQVGYRRFESESKLLAQKNFGRWVVAYNATLEAEWEGENLEERVGELQQSLGVSYEVTPRLLFGAECLHEVEFPDWSKAERGKFFAGPNVSVRAGKYWGTLTALAQVTPAGDEPDLQLRAIFGFSF
ncbi:MAG TPA: DUF6662 family protein [Chthoniobacterales bacterium]|nr:DUF6662 family protein [Chthoniobacterales bacterium]